jgi:serine protease Do
VKRDEAEPTEKSLLGLTITTLTDEMRTELNVPAGQEGLVVTSVDETSEAFEKGLRAGDVITEAGQQKLSTLAELDERIADAKEAGRKSLLLLVRRAGEPRFVALSLED